MFTSVTNDPGCLHLWQLMVTLCPTNKYQDIGPKKKFCRAWTCPVQHASDHYLQLSIAELFLLRTEDILPPQSLSM